MPNDQLQGTPQTLTKAIENGIEAYETDRQGETQAQCVEHIRRHVADFFRNGIAPTVLVNEDSEVDKHLKAFERKLKQTVQALFQIDKNLLQFD